MIAYRLVVLATVVTSACGTVAGDYRVRAQFPHDRAAFTQGLLFYDGRLYESTGQYGRSELRVTDVQTGNVIQSRRLPADRFGEGLARLGDRLYQLTWQSGIGYVYELETLTLADSFEYAGEGWGLASDGRSLIISDGTPVLRFLDGMTYQVNRELQVTDGGAPFSQINELEYIDGQLFANVYQTDWIVRIDLESGVVSDRYSLRGLLSADDRTALTDVLNGIAYSAEDGRLFVTGKNWPYLFDIQLIRGDSLFPTSAR
jgi:glutamine cyclotransferase